MAWRLWFIQLNTPFSVLELFIVLPMSSLEYLAAVSSKKNISSVDAFILPKFQFKTVLLG